MGLTWIHEPLPQWDAQKARIVGGTAEGVFDRSYRDQAEGHLIPGDWWRVERNGETVAFGWLDINWGDAEILLATATEARRQGIGDFVLANLEQEARARGINYLHNVVRATHPEREVVSQWFSKRGFQPSEDGRLFRSVVRRKTA